MIYTRNCKKIATIEKTDVVYNADNFETESNTTALDKVENIKTETDVVLPARPETVERKYAGFAETLRAKLNL